MSSRFNTLKVNYGKSEIKRELITGRKNLVVGRFLAIVDDLGEKMEAGNGVKIRCFSKQKT